MFGMAAVMTVVSSPQSGPKEPALPDNAKQFVSEMVKHELQAEEKDHSHWMYRLHREDDKGAQDRQVIETKDGQLAKTLLINGQPLTADQREKDQERMQKLVSDPEERARRERRIKQDEEKAMQLLKAIPDAFIFKYEGTEGELVRLSFAPNSNYSPPTRELMVYHAMKGKLWVDRAAMRLAKIEGQLIEDVKFGWGLLGHLDKGGTFTVVQKHVGDSHWETVSLDLNMQGRALMFKTINVRQKQVLTDFHRVPDDLTIAKAFDILQKGETSVSANSHSGK